MFLLLVGLLAMIFEELLLDPALLVVLGLALVPGLDPALLILQHEHNEEDSPNTEYDRLRTCRDAGRWRKRLMMEMLPHVKP